MSHPSKSLKCPQPSRAHNNLEGINVDLQNTITFGTALDLLKKGTKVARAGWNGKGMFIYLNLGSHDFSKGPIAAGEYINGVNSQLFDGGQVETATRMPNINMHAADGSTVTGWLASQTDMLAEDWVVVQ